MQVIALTAALCISVMHENSPLETNRSQGIQCKLLWTRSRLRSSSATNDSVPILDEEMSLTNAVVVDVITFAVTLWLEVLFE